MASVVNPGDEVILLEPYFMSYRGLLGYLGAKLVPVPLDEKTNWHIDMEALKEAITPKTKMIVSCSPNNPSGSVFTKKELQAIAEVATDNKTMVLSDEVYNEFVWDGNKHVSMAAIPGMRENTIVIGSFSKTWGCFVRRTMTLSNCTCAPCCFQRSRACVTLGGSGALAFLRRSVSNCFTSKPCSPARTSEAEVIR